MADQPKTQSSLEPETPVGAAFELPSDGAPQTEPGPTIRLLGRNRRFAPDDRLARPEFGEFGEEVIDGVRIECSPAPAEHADPQCRLAAVASICLAEGYIASTELLTRTEAESDFATDVCVRKAGVDPETGGRYLEELSFEVAHTQTLENLERVRVLAH